MPAKIDASDKSERYQKGWAKLQELHGTHGQKVIEELNQTAPDMAQYIIEYAFGDLYSRPGLDLKSREIATIASLITQGQADRELKAHILAALKLGLTQQEITEIILQLTAYTGFPKALNAMRVAVDAFEAGE